MLHQQILHQQQLLAAYQPWGEQWGVAMPAMYMCDPNYLPTHPIPTSNNNTMYLPHHQQHQNLPDLPHPQQHQILPEHRANNTLWIGDLQPWMDKDYLLCCFSEVSNVKLFRNQTGDGFGFIEFHSHGAAKNALQSYNGTMMPNAEQSFRLNWAAFSSRSDLSIFVGNLAVDVTDDLLHEIFSSRYPSVKDAKVLLDKSGRSKCCGFVNFNDEIEMSRAVTEMNGVPCSGRPMRIGATTPKKYSSEQQYNSQGQPENVIITETASNNCLELEETIKNLKLELEIKEELHQKRVNKLQEEIKLLEEKIVLLIGVVSIYKKVQENDGIRESFPRKLEETHRHMMHPVAGGAPFIACSRCFELLRLPRKHISSTKSQQKLKCGACSSIILLELGNKDLTVPVSGSFDHVVTEMDDRSSVAVDANVSCKQNSSNVADKYVLSDSNYNFLPKVSLADKKSNSDEYEKQSDPLSSVSSLSKDQQMSDAHRSVKHGSSSAELDGAEVKSLPHPISSTEECPGHCSANIVVAQSDSGDKGTKSEFDRNVSWQNSVRDSAVSTEIDMSSKEFPKSCVSQDTCDESKEQRLRDDKGAESSSAILVNSRSGDSMKLAQNVEFGTSQVFVNGHLIPENLVQKAELLAGPIQPGEYWYDMHAGFWGVMGYPCLGIIMPNIEEFNYPMPENCAAGNTEVFVNGRELHQRDLDLLAGRGLPKTRGRCYIIGISGEVVDEDTGKELDNIGKLAPTVERAKYGFGMKVPRFIS